MPTPTPQLQMDLFERHRIHIACLDGAANLHDLSRGDLLHDDTGKRRVAAHLLRIGKQEAATSIVEQPLGLPAALQRAEGDPVGLEMLRLPIVQRNENVVGRRPGRPPQLPARRRDHQARHRRDELSPSHELGTIPFNWSMSRRACGTTALSGWLRIRFSSSWIASWLRPSFA